jgi:TatA/E family protein of Tat protein translocase
MLLFISGGEIFIVLLFVLIFFGADKIPEFARMMGKGVREFKKATDDIKREFTDSTSGLMNDIRSIQTNLTDTLTKEIAEPVQEIVKDTEKTFDDFQEQYQEDYHYTNPDTDSFGNEYHEETQASLSENTDDTSGSQQADVSDETEPASDYSNPAEA